ncbi:Aspartic proteinase nepenthesin-2 precursor, putative [Ricinus communis]|uniref:Aspartic proteinase nepenthesin-2, putative n=2 Tax=Ricinus communis TaxID=3988 RepID=B9SGX5_RICCO|nr:Aspartic proteinase nepenthesin-2 precursor, putative [Ricinus communis]
MSCKGLQEMKLVCFLTFMIVLATSSFAKLEEYKLSANQSSILLNLYHVHGDASSLEPNSSSSFCDILSRDEEHVKFLSSRLRKKDVQGASFSRHKSGHLLEPNSANIPLNPGLSIGSGNYYLKLGLGSPPKYYTMILDTGSSLSWLQCKPCVVYCHSQVDPLFEPSASNTYRPLYCSSSECSLLKAATLNDPLCTASGVCVYTASYGDASYSMGYLSRDLLTLTPSQTLPSFTYGCGQDNEGLFGKAAGIVGLARDKLSMLAQLSPKYGYAFSYCLPTSTSSGGGFLSIGKISPSSYKFTPMIRNSQNPSLYFLRLAAITVAGRPVGVAAAGYQVPTIIDSGTVVTRLPISIYAALREAFVKIMSRRYEQAPAYSILDTCFKGSLKSMSGAPEIRMIFQGGADLSLRAPNILIEADKGIACLAFASSNQIAIIGNHQQQTYNIAYDVSASKIGFAPGGCR